MPVTARASDTHGRGCRAAGDAIVACIKNSCWLCEAWTWQLMVPVVQCSVRCGAQRTRLATREQREQGLGLRPAASASPCWLRPWRLHSRGPGWLPTSTCVTQRCTIHHTALYSGAAFVGTFTLQCALLLDSTCFHVSKLIMEHH